MSKKKLVSIEELKAKYGEETVTNTIQELEKQLGGKVSELDETLFMQVADKPEASELPNHEEIIQIIGLMTCLYLAEGKSLLLIDAQKNKKSKHIHRNLSQRLNNLFVNNRVIMDYFHKQFNWTDAVYQNELADSIESILNMFIACKQEDRLKCIEDFKIILSNKYLNKDGEQSTTTETSN